MAKEYEILITQTETNVITDTACTKAASDEKWLLHFLKYLYDTALNKVQVFPSRKVVVYNGVFWDTLGQTP